MTFDPTSVEVTCVTVPKDHYVQVPWEYVNVCGYRYQFCRNYHIHTYTHILRTYYVHTTYYVQNQWSHSLSGETKTNKTKRKWENVPLIHVFRWLWQIFGHFCPFFLSLLKKNGQKTKQTNKQTNKTKTKQNKTK